MLVHSATVLLLAPVPPPQPQPLRFMPPMAMADGGEKFSQSTKLRGEVEDPFSKLRLFAFPAAFGGAAIASYFGITSALAELAGVRSASPDTYTNLAIDVAALGTIGFFWRQEILGNEKRLKRIAAGAALAALRVQPLTGPKMGKSIRLVDLRSGRGSNDPFDEQSKRVVVVAAETEALAATLATARAASAAIAEADLLVVPLLLEIPAASGSIPRVAMPPPALVLPDGEDTGSNAHMALPQGLGAWQEVLDQELETALGQDKNVASRGLTLVLKKNGRVGTRRLGTPDWVGLVGDVAARATAGLDVANI